MMFRPMPALTAAALPVLALLIALGVWQSQRAQWKAGLIEDWTVRESAPPAPLGEALCGGALEGPVAADPPGGAPIRIYGAGPDGTPGWLILELAGAADCAPGSRVLVQTGFETIGGETSRAPETLLLTEWPEAGAFTPRNDPETGQYFRFDRADLAAALDAPPESLVPVYARWEDRPPVERASVTPATHVGYAITWYGLALALVVIYGELHRRAGRLRFSR